MTAPLFPEYASPPGAPLSKAEFERTHIIDTVLKLLVTMIESLQKAAAAQSNRLRFLTDWQRAYTDVMDQIHPFIAGSDDGISGDSDEERDARDDLNRLNSTYTEQLRSNRSIVSDDAKALQTNVNQITDAVNQQTNMASSLIQQLTTLLAKIFP